MLRIVQTEIVAEIDRYLHVCHFGCRIYGLGSLRPDSKVLVCGKIDSIEAYRKRVAVRCEKPVIAGIQRNFRPGSVPVCIPEQPCPFRIENLDFEGFCFRRIYCRLHRSDILVVIDRCQGYDDFPFLSCGTAIGNFRFLRAGRNHECHDRND